MFYYLHISNLLPTEFFSLLVIVMETGSFGWLSKAIPSLDILFVLMNLRYCHPGHFDLYTYSKQKMPTLS